MSSPEREAARYERKTTARQRDSILGWAGQKARERAEDALNGALADEVRRAMGDLERCEQALATRDAEIAALRERVAGMERERNALRREMVQIGHALVGCEASPSEGVPCPVEEGAVTVDELMRRIAELDNAEREQGEWLTTFFVEGAAPEEQPGPWEIKARIASLEEGLRPFAAVGRVVDFYVEDALPNEAQRTFPYHVIKCDEDGPARVTLDLDDFRRARALLTPAGGENDRKGVEL